MNYPTKTLLAALIALPFAISAPSAQTLTGFEIGQNYQSG